MEDLNNVPSTGTFGNSINQVNQNFGLVKGAIENVEGRTIRSKGLFPTQAALTAAYPSPKVGDYAYVGSGLPATIYDCLVAGTWHNTGQTGGSETVDLNNYSTKSETSASVANSLAQATARMGYGECTVSGTELAVSIPNFTLPTSGGTIHIKMSAVGTGASTLSINGTTAKTLWYNGKAVSSDNTWKSNEIISVFYDGTRFLASNSQGSDIGDIYKDSREGDFEIGDEIGDVLVRFGNGHIKTKNFDSSKDAPLTNEAASDGDLEISDDNNNVLVRFKNGHVITKNFNSAEIGSSMLEKFKNKKIAIIGDSISTYNGWLPSNITGYDGAAYATYYPSGNVDSPSKTWWYQMMQLLGLPVGGDTINVCAWSGSYVSGDSTSTTSAAAGCSTRRITDLAIRGWNPDIVIIFISCNDFAYDKALGTWDVNSAIVAEGNITEMRAAYALMINKIHIAYPNARVFCCTNLDDYKRDKTAGYPSNNNNGVTTFTWNQSIKQIADAMACDVIDMHACGLNYANFQQFAVDAGTHPNAAGLSMMAQKAASELIAKY